MATALSCSLGKSVGRNFWGGQPANSILYPWLIRSRIKLLLEMVCPGQLSHWEGSLGWGGFKKDATFLSLSYTATLFSDPACLHNLCSANICHLWCHLSLEKDEDSFFCCCFLGIGNPFFLSADLTRTDSNSFPSNNSPEKERGQSFIFETVSPSQHFNQIALLATLTKAVALAINLIFCWSIRYRRHCLV